MRFPINFFNIIKIKEGFYLEKDFKYLWCSRNTLITVLGELMSYSFSKLTLTKLNMIKTEKSMIEKICLITGANTGIGRAIFLGFAKMGATVVIVCRNKTRGEAAMTELKEKSGNSSIDLFGSLFLK